MISVNIITALKIALSFSLIRSFPTSRNIATTITTTTGSVTNTTAIRITTLFRFDSLLCWDSPFQSFPYPHIHIHTPTQIHTHSNLCNVNFNIAQHHIPLFFHLSLNLIQSLSSSAWSNMADWHSGWEFRWSLIRANYLAMCRPNQWLVKTFPFIA